MRDAEHTIERLLAGLRNAEPQPGIEHRILETIQAHETVASVPFWNRLQPQTLPAFAVRLASALAITCVFVAIALHQHWRYRQITVIRRHSQYERKRLRKQSRRRPPLQLGGRPHGFGRSMRAL